jgi:hypothetical protein
LHVADRRADSTFVQTAENVASRPGLYDLPEPDDAWLGDHIDLWGYEAGLPAALDQLSARNTQLDANVWLRDLVPFVAGLFSRGPDANSGQNNEARIMAFQEMLAPVMVSQWTVLHYPCGHVVTSDRAVAPIDTPVGPGIAVPLDTSCALLLTRCTERRVATHQADHWYTTVSHHDMSTGDGSKLRDGLARFAMNSIFGSTLESVAIDTRLIGLANTEWPALIVNPSECDLACHLYDYFRLASAIRVRPDEAQAAADRIDLDAVLPGWRSPIAVQLNFPERTRGDVALVDGNSLRLSLELGLELCRKRRAVGDFRRGGFTIVPLENVRTAVVPLGEMCRQGPDGRAHRSYLRNPKTGSLTKIDLPT